MKNRLSIFIRILFTLAHPFERPFKRLSLGFIFTFLIFLFLSPANLRAEDTGSVTLNPTRVNPEMSSIANADTATKSSIRSSGSGDGNSIFAAGTGPVSINPADTPSEPITLRTAQQLALRNNEQVQTARNRIKTAREQLTQSRSFLLPQVSLRAERTRRKETTGRFSPFREERTFDWGVDLRQNLFQGGKDWYGVEIGKQGMLRTKLTTYRRTQEILFRTSRVFYNVILARKNIRIAKNTLRRARDQLEQAKARYKVGKITKNAVLRARVDVADAQRQLKETRNNHKNAREALAVEIGQPRVSGRIEVPGTTKLVDTGVKRFQRRSLKTRRDFHAARARLKQTRAQVNFEQADWFPDVDLVASYDSFHRHEALGLEEDWRVILQGSYPLFSGWRETSQVDQAKTQHNTARQQYKRLRREIRRDVRQAYSTLTTQHSVVNSLENQVQSARLNYRQVSAQFEEGLVDSVDVSDALTTLNESELRLANARTTLRLDRLRLKLATGTHAQSLLKKRVEKAARMTD